MSTTYAISVTNSAEAEEVSSLEAKFEALEAKINALEAKNNALEAQVSTNLRRRELGTAWHEAFDDLNHKFEKVTQGARQLYINENLASGQEVTVYQAGPIKIEAGCGLGSFCNSGCRRSLNQDQADQDQAPRQLCHPFTEVCMRLTLYDANEDLQVFGQINYDSGIDGFPIVNNVLAADTVYKQEMWDVSSSGNDPDNGAIWAGGYYLGWTGDAFIGLQRDDGLLDGGNCQLAGVFDYFIPTDHEW